MYLNKFISKGVELRRAIDAAYESHEADREISISDFFERYIVFPEPYTHVTETLEAAGFKIFPPITTPLSVSFTPSVTARINQYKTGLGFSADVIAVVCTDDASKPSVVRGIEGTIFKSFL